MNTHVAWLQYTVLETVQNIVKIAATEENEASYVTKVRELIARNLDTEDLADGVYQFVIKSECADRTRIQVGAEYAKFGLNIARRTSESLALERFMLGVRLALRFK